MIAFGSSITEAEPYRKYAEPGIRLAAEPDSEVYAFAAVGPIGRSYNLLLEAAAAHEDLEALVLLHPHAEIADRRFCEKVRRALADPEVGVVGCVGASGVRSIAWWEGEVTRASVIHRYEERGGGDVLAFSWAGAGAPDARTGEADTVDGFLLVLSPWAVRNVRFDESLTFGHGFDFDYCAAVRAAGRKVLATDLRAIHHRSLELVSDLEIWVEAHVMVAEKWDDSLAGVDADAATWKERARRAEAEREAARAVARFNALGAEARVLELERALAEKTESISWRLTAPLRRLNSSRRVAAERARRRRS